MRFIEIDLQKPDFQSLRAAQELIEDDQPILFPGEVGILLALRFSPANRQKVTSMAGVNGRDAVMLFVAEDFDSSDSTSYGFPVQMADVNKNRAFHTLVQLCDAPLITLPAEDTREGAKVVDANGADIGVVTSGSLGPSINQPVALARLGFAAPLSVAEMLPTEDAAFVTTVGGCGVRTCAVSATAP